MLESNKALLITQDVINDIRATIGSYPPETGGILGAGDNGIISHYYYDSTGRNSNAGYIPDVNTINELLSKVWMPNGILMVGIVHSHADKNCVPSCGDISYGYRILQALDTVDCFYLPIVTCCNNEFIMACYELRHNSEQKFVCRKTSHKIVP